MQMWATEFTAGTLDDLAFSREVEVTLPAGKLLYASVALAGITLAGPVRRDESTDKSDAFAWARVTRAGGIELSDQKLGPYPVFSANPTTWSGRLPESRPTLSFAVETRFVQATVVIQVVQTDDPLDVVLKWRENVQEHPPIA